MVKPVNQLVNCLRLTIFIALLSLPIMGSYAQDRADFFIEAYGRVDRSFAPVIERVERIFENIVLVARSRFHRSPDLVVIDSGGEPWAVALPDNSIVLSMGAIRICYDGVNQEIGDARIAFVLGHEVAHLSQQDFWQHEIVKAFASGDTESVEIALKLARKNAEISNSDAMREEIRSSELKADDLGFLYASLAGHNLREGLATNTGESRSFFEIWHQTTGAGKSVTHFNARVRQKLVENKLSFLAEQADFALYALALSNLGKYQDAIVLFEKVAKHYPSPEILNNLAYANFQLAINTIGKNNLRFLFRTSMENNQGIDRFSKDISFNSKHLAKEYLFRAKELLELSLRARPDYLISLANLAVVNFYLEDYHFARALAEKALTSSPSDVELLMLRSIIMFKQEKEIDMWPRVVTTLENLRKNYNSALLDLNLAALYSLRGRNRLAVQYYKTLVDEPQQTDEIIGLACARIPDYSACTHWQERETAFDSYSHTFDIESLTDRLRQKRAGEAIELITLDDSDQEFLLINGFLAASRFIVDRDFQIDCRHNQRLSIPLNRARRCSRNTAYFEETNSISIVRSY